MFYTLRLVVWTFWPVVRLFLYAAAFLAILAACWFLVQLLVSVLAAVSGMSAVGV